MIQKLQGDLPWAGDHGGIEAENVWHLERHDDNSSGKRPRSIDVFDP